MLRAATGYLLDWPGLGWLAALVVLLDVIALLRAITRAHGVESTLAWMFGILAFPLLGALLYLALANPNVGRRTSRKRASAASVREESGLAEPGPDDVPGSLVRLARSVTGLAPTRGNAVDLLASDNKAFAVIERELRRARRSIWAEYYIVSNDVTGHRFLDVLAEKAAEGVEVRFLYDGLGSMNLDERRLATIREAGGRTSIFLPVNPLARRWALHLRNHRKLVIVDGEIGFTGGMNVGDEYSGRARRKGAQHFRDTHLLLRGPAVGDLALIFAEDWTFATEEPLGLPPRPAPIPGADALVAVVPSGPDQEANATGHVYFGAICAARARLYLTSPYFVPDQPTVRALVGAALSGIDVRVLVPARSDVRLVRIASRTYFGPLLEGGVRIYEYQPSMLHSKSLVVDGTWGVVGSANVDMRSFRLNFELSALVRDGVFARRLEERFLADLAESTEVCLEDLRQGGFLGRLKSGAARLLSPLL